MKTKKISDFYVFLMLILISFWGSSFVVVKIALRDGLTPIAIATFRSLIAGGFFLAILLFRKIREREYNLFVKKRDIPTLLFLALTGVTFFFIAQYTGIQMAGASLAAIFVCFLSPILIAIISARIFNEYLKKSQIFGMGIAALGTLIVITGGILIIPSNREFLIGSLILLSTPILWTMYSLSGKKIMEEYDPFLVVAYITLLGGLCLIPFSLAEKSLYQIFQLSTNGWLAILFLSITCTMLGNYIWFYVLKKIGAAITSSFLFVQPLVTVLLAVTFIGEEMSLSTLIGGFLIFSGVYLVNYRR